MLVEPRRTVVRRRDLALDGWPPDLDGLRVAVVGDLHAGVRHVDVARVRRVARALARRRPEVVLVAGDLMDDRSAGARRLDPRDVAGALAGVRGAAPIGDALPLLAVL